ncbi:DEAD/DEAH box helicase [Mechercharimyces sp. CAU 1602]|uniref:DEAD/DEAH box helicase n=1 Tax=Mechercharimyces sp. CAU 1602 TaxID=2973933 RepID=UPI002161A117|nr:DEAD/DEAH box helicase [Mechercharimyces sp. CAU 1602]MCS1350942.1 DEAD/DEAH box helicase [Mechercharimyces sp. CAU 1602]
MRDINNLISYWIKSIEDGDQLNFDEDRLDFIEVPTNEIKVGELFPSSFEAVSKKFDKWNENVDVFICPCPQYRENHSKKKKSLIFPLVIPAKLDESGSLHPHKEVAPFIPRKYLEPTEHSSSIGENYDAESYRRLNPHSEEGTWEMVYRDAQSLVNKVVGQKVIVDGYRPLSHSMIWFGRISNMATYQIRQCYSDMKKKGEYSPLLHRLIDAPVGEKQTFLKNHDQFSSLHFGQMTNQYSLTDSQRKALHHFFALEEGQLLAVNGPPGTGKTTLLQSIVSSAWIQSALTEDEPPLILATSSNNKAIENILDSFKAALPSDGSQEILSKRWIEGLSSYGLFCIAQSKYDKYDGLHPLFTRKYNNQSRKMDILGYHSDFEKENIDQKVDLYLKNCSSYLNKNIDDLNDAKVEIYRMLEDTCQQIVKITTLYTEKKKMDDRLYNEYGSIHQLGLCVDKHTKEEEGKYHAYQESKELYSNWLNHVKKRSFFHSLIGYLQKIDNEIFLRENKANLISSSKSLKDKYIRQLIQREEMKCLSEYESYREQRVEMVAFKERLLLMRREWSDWRNQNNINDESEASMFKILDEKLRFQAFLLATHYWEARWLMDVNAGLDKNDYQRWKRYAKLTPCVVATMSSAPGFFKTSSYPEEYLYGSIDLLIVDEAGQVKPEQAGTVLALAKKAVIVGDTEQLEPIAGVNAHVDEGNIKKYAIQTFTEIDSFHKSGLSASQGNLMRLAQRISRFGEHEELGGMLLREHYRCREDIIQYSNELCYQGRLIPKKKNPEKGEEKYRDIPMLGFVNVEGEAEKIVSSWQNKREAVSIAYWINKNKKLLTDYDSNLANVIAVVTPYKQQARLITRYLKSEFRIDNLTINTVHALQGAEKDIIIFSPTFSGEKCKNQIPFYDKTKNLLNVAVSRAKESFLVFGDKETFGRYPNSPSFLLNRRVNSVSSFDDSDLKAVDQIVNKNKETVKKGISKSILVAETVNIADHGSTIYNQNIKR